MLKIKSRKKLLIPALAMVLLVAMAGSAMAASLNWTYGFDTNSTSSSNFYDTCAIQAALYMVDIDDIDDELGCLSDDYHCNGYDGDFGSGTEDAVEYFQNYFGLSSVDGIVGTETWSALKANCFGDYYYDGDDYYILNEDSDNFLLIGSTYYNMGYYGFHYYDEYNDWYIWTSHDNYRCFES